MEVNCLLKAVKAIFLLIKNRKRCRDNSEYVQSVYETVEMTVISSYISSGWGYAPDHTSVVASSAY